MKQDFIIEDNILLSYEGTNKEVVIPENIKIIGESAFYKNEYVEKIILPKNLKKINRWAFEQCKNLKEINLPDSLEYIASEAIIYCDELKEITIPPNLKNVDVFLYRNKNLEKITLKGEYSYRNINYIIGSDNLNVKKVIGNNIICEDRIVYDKDKTTIVSYLESKRDKVFKIPSNITKLCTYSFTENKYLKELHLHKDLKEMEFNSINTNKIRTLIIPASLKEIDPDIFQGAEVGAVKIIIEGNEEELNKNKKLKEVLKVVKNIKFKSKKTLEELLEEGKTFREASNIIKEQER